MIAKTAGQARALTAALGLAALVPSLGCSKTQPAKPPAVEPTARVVYVVVTPTRAPDRMDPVLAAALTAMPQPSSSPIAAEPLPRFTGKGHEASNLFSLSPGLYIFRLEHTGERNFIVDLVDERGRPIENLVNEIGPFSGSKAIQIQRAGKYLLNIDADGDWSISVSSPGSSSQSAPSAEPARTPVPQPVAPFRPLKVPTESAWLQIRNFVVHERNSIGSVHYSGDVHNVTGRSVKVKVIARAYTQNGVLVETADSYPDPREIPAGGDAHFEYFIRDPHGVIHTIRPEAVAVN